ncbi:MAG: MBL fold metallo-hydrolase [Syntrophomonadaceae bacterium]|nr:MBL fold metallo-hydrolase [Syntrophomonadaceae bacterium]
MLERTRFGPVTLYRSGRSVGDFVPYYVHSFLIEDVLIDTGCAWVRSELLAALEGETIAKIINTHHHEDHTGNNLAVQRKFGAPIYAPRASLSFLERPQELKLLPYQLYSWEYPEPSSGLPLGERVQAGEYTLQVIPAPGHCDAHVCFYEPTQKWLFSGDIFCGKGFKFLRADEDYHQILESLQNLLSLPIDTIFCSLIGAVPEGHSMLTAKVDFMQRLRDSVMELHQQGLSPAEICLQVLGEENQMTQLTAGHYSKQNTVDSILGILKSV